MNTIDLKNRTAIVTGGAQGFGLAITNRFLESGANVIIWDIDEEVTQKLLADKNNKNLSASKVDVTNFEEVQSEILKITSKNKIDILKKSFFNFLLKSLIFLKNILYYLFYLFLIFLDEHHEIMQKINHD